MIDLPRLYAHTINRVIELAGPDKFLHVNAGLAIWFAVLVTTRSPWRGVLAATTIEAANEVLDALYMGRIVWPDTMGDVAATLIWPILLTLWLGRAAKRPAVDIG